MQQTQGEQNADDGHCISVDSTAKLFDVDSPTYSGAVELEDRKWNRAIAGKEDLGNYVYFAGGGHDHGGEPRGSYSHRFAGSVAAPAVRGLVSGEPFG